MSQAAQTHTFSAQTGKVLQLMIHSLYTNKDIFLRELISNASDACEKLRYEALTSPELLDGGTELEIKVTYEASAGTLTIEDNGIGMNAEELVENLGTIAKSGTQEFMEALQSKDAVNQIGQFGVGFYSGFMVADKMVVQSRKAGTDAANQWESDGAGEFTITPIGPESIARGTRITLHMRDDAKEYLDKHKLTFIISTYSDHIAYPIMLGEAGGEAARANSGSALWTRSKSEISDEQYKEFYRHVAHAPDTPWMTLHNKAEGKLEYTNLLFIPSHKPFDLFHPERQTRVKLYVKRVFITEKDANLVPSWLRFLRGVVDSEDLPLNISRETLQDNPLLVRMNEALAKKVLAELKKRLEKDASEYEQFWEHFGAVLKEGLCESIAPKDAILEACLFNSTSAEHPRTTLKDYIARMRGGQEHIYYLLTDSVESGNASPQLEGFKARGVEVLLLNDHVDEFWSSVVEKYDGKLFKSALKAGEELDKFESSDANNESAEEKKDALEEANLEKLFAALKHVYGDEVRDIRASHKLTQSPVCLAIEDGDMEIRFEKFLRENKQYPGRMPKILEVNPRHPIIHSLASKVEANDNAADDADVKDVAWLLLDQARLQEGEEIGNSSEFSRRLSHFLAKALA